MADMLYKLVVDVKLTVLWEYECYDYDVKMK